MSNLFATDTNVLIYLHDKTDERKRNIAENILGDCPKIPAQVISEYINVTKRMLKHSKVDIMIQCARLFRNCEILPTTHPVLVDAATLIKKYDFQIFDSIIVAAALKAGCSILYSEDMQNGLVVNNMTILNPFVV